MKMWPHSCFLYMNHIEVKVLLSEKKIGSFLRKITFGPRTRCLKCGYTKIRQLPDQRYWCKKCRRRFSLTSNSWLKGKKISLKQLYLLLDCWLKGKTVKDTIDSVRLSRQTVYLWFRVFRTYSPQIDKIFQGNCETDETYVGPVRKGPRKGHTWKENKTPVLGIYERESGLVKIEVVPDAVLDYIKPFILTNIDLGQGHIFSDQYRPYWHLPKLGYQHTMVDHFNHEYKETNHIEGFWSVFKRTLKRSYWAVRPENLSNYGREIVYRFNTRRSPDTPLTFLEKTLSTDTS